MARARNLKPGFFTNEALAELDPLVRLIFAGLWTVADFKGCIEWRPKRLKIQVLPYDDYDFDKAADELCGAGFLVRYEVAGRQYVKIPNFLKHQNPHKKERDVGSDIPDVPTAEVLETQQVDPDPVQTGSKPELAGPLPSNGFPLPPIPHTDSSGAFLDTVMDGLRSRFNLNVLRDEPGWCDSAMWAEANGFTTAQFLECFDLLSKQKWRKGRVTPKNVGDNLPELPKIRDEIAEQDVQPGQRNSTGKTETDDGRFAIGFTEVQIMQ